MFSAEIKKLLVEVITSWQVIAVTVVLVIYVFLVNYVARIYHRRPRPDISPGAKSKKSADPVLADDKELEEESAEDK
jgi:hypothetical protein